MLPVDRDWIGALSQRRPAVFAQFLKDLAATGTSTAELSEQVMLCGFAGAVAPFVFWALLSSTGLGLTPFIPAWAGIAGAAGLGSVPLLRLRKASRAARRAARRSVGCFLDLVVLALAGGLGIEGAIHSAAAVCETSISEKIVQAIGEAHERGRHDLECAGGTGQGACSARARGAVCGGQPRRNRRSTRQIDARGEGGVDKKS